MEYLVVLITDDYLHNGTDQRIAKLGFERQLATNDDTLALRLPDQVFVANREGGSAAKLRSDVLAELGNADISGFVLVAEGFSSGRT